ncbi:MAG TPA: protease inhibitor I42 family protein [Candidatus Acidoferrales bacterium]|nr:protease inhibitor I42 family protein [Candidatus Acidoferrales bacterium]
MPTSGKMVNHRGMMLRSNLRMLAGVAAAIAFSLAVIATVEARTVTVTEKDSGSETILARGDTLEVSLPATSGTGYVWQVAKVESSILSQSGNATFEHDGKAMPGAMRHQTFHFSANAAGAGLLELRYLRPWEKDTPPAKSFTLNVLVK